MGRDAICGLARKSGLPQANLAFFKRASRPTQPIFQNPAYSKPGRLSIQVPF